MKTLKELGDAARRVEYYRIVGSALHEGADETSLMAYLLTTSGGVLDATSAQNLVVLVKSKSRIPRLGTGELQQLGGRDAFRALFGLPPASAMLAPIVGQVQGVSFNLDARNVPDSHDQDNIRAALVKLGYAFHFDEFAHAPLVMRSGVTLALEDHLINRAWFELDEAFKLKPSLEYFNTVVDDLVRQHGHHPVLDYFTSLPPWDGIPRLDTWLIDFAGVADSAYARAVGTLPLLAAVRRVRHANNPHGVKFDELLVLVGHQGSNKSKLFAALCPKPQWFTDSISLGDDPKSVIERSRGVWIVEIPELQGSPRETERIKAFLSRSVDGPVRLAWGRVPVRVPRQFVNFGTTNDQHFLRDPTGNRRFWPVSVGVQDPETLAGLRDQLWAEAALREATGCSLHLPESLWPDAAAVQELHREADPWEAILEMKLDLTKDVIPVTATWSFVGLGQDVSKQDNRAAKRISDIMQRLGYPVKKNVRIRLPNGSTPTIRAWVRDPGQGIVDSLSDLGAALDDKLPF